MSVIKLRGHQHGAAVLDAIDSYIKNLDMPSDVKTHSNNALGRAADMGALEVLADSIIGPKAVECGCKLLQRHWGNPVIHQRDHS
jgi:hypothetical protein